MAPGFTRDALRMVLSSVLVKVSRQSSETDVRVTDKPELMHGAGGLFGRKAMELGRCLAAFAQALPAGPPKVSVRVDDVTELATVHEGSVDLVVSSPPYANTYDYAAHHARRFAWLGLDPAPLAQGELGAARWFAQDPAEGAARFARELGALMAALARVLKPRGAALLVLADGATVQGALRADEAVEAAARGAGLAVRAVASQERKVFDPVSVQAFARSPKREHVLAVGRPAR